MTSHDEHETANERGIYQAKAIVQAIDAAIERDGGAAYRDLFREALLESNAVEADDRGGYKPTGGALVSAGAVGGPCARKIWYAYHWRFPSSKPSGKLQRVFERGKIVEAQMIALLRLALEGPMSHSRIKRVFTKDKKGGQYSVNVPPLFGFLDGIARDIPGIPKGKTAIVEVKSHSDDSFTALVRDGVQKTKPEHYAQIQMYMHGFALKGTPIPLTLYLAKNSDDEEIYGEWVHQTSDGASLVDYASDIIHSPVPPKRIGNASWWQCKFCDYYDGCQSNSSLFEAPVSCRSCANGNLTKNVWTCDLAGDHRRTLTTAKQREACALYQIHPVKGQ